MLPAEFVIWMKCWSRSVKFIPMVAANFTRAISSGEEAWYSTSDRSDSEKVGVTLWQRARALMVSQTTKL